MGLVPFGDKVGFTKSFSLWPPHVIKKDSHIAVHTIDAGLQAWEMKTLSFLQQGLAWCGDSSRLFWYQPSTRAVIFPVMFVGVQLKFVFLAEKQEGQLGTHTAHMSWSMIWPSAWHWLPDS